MDRQKQSQRLHGNEAASKRVRAAKACQRCNAKRVKCDATVVGQPCSRCRRNGITECRLIDTRRGRYSRETTKAQSQAAADVSQNREATTSSERAGGTPAAPSPRNGRSNSPAVDLDFTRGAEGGPRSENTEPHVSPCGTAPSTSPSYREVSWSAMFDHFLESHQNDRRDVIDKCSITYLGESFPLALVLGDVQDGGKTRLHHPGPPLQDTQTPATTSSQRVLPTHLLREDINCLESKKCFDKPRVDVFESLINTFLDTYFPIYPIVHRQEFIDQYHNDTLPWILLHSCCFVSATFCPISVIHRAGFTSRKQARFGFYRKAKALFDTGHESNKIVLLQSVIMLTFWGGGPNAYWNFYSWIGTACTIAETLGIHRSMAGTNIDAKDRSLLKRLWWILVVRDAFRASLVGRPLRINMDQGDTEMLTVQDFEHDIRSLEGVRHPLNQTFAHYQIQVAKLSLVLHRILFTRFVPSQKRLSSAVLEEHIQQWKREVPPEVD